MRIIQKKGIKQVLLTSTKQNLKRYNLKLNPCFNAYKAINDTC